MTSQTPPTSGQTLESDWRKAQGRQVVACDGVLVLAPAGDIAARIANNPEQQPEK